MQRAFRQENGMPGRALRIHEAGARFARDKKIKKNKNKDNFGNDLSAINTSI
jgi:hypothetical protein